jgi:hypothetical protein
VIPLLHRFEETFGPFNTKPYSSSDSASNYPNDSKFTKCSEDFSNPTQQNQPLTKITAEVGLISRQCVHSRGRLRHKKGGVVATTVQIRIAWNPAACDLVKDGWISVMLPDRSRIGRKHR